MTRVEGMVNVNGRFLGKSQVFGVIAILRLVVAIQSAAISSRGGELVRDALFL